MSRRPRKPPPRRSGPVHPAEPTAAEIAAIDALLAAGHLDRLEVAARALVARYPEHFLGWVMLGLGLNSRGMLPEALSAAMRAARLAPGDARIHRNVGYLFNALGQLGAAEASYRRALEIEPGCADTHIELGKILAALGRSSEAASAFRRALEIEPGNPIAGHHLAACSEGGVPDRAPEDYVRRLYDEFSGSFDRVLGSLGYGGPQQTADALAALFREPKGDLQVLDAGCGTGLCGVVARPYAARLTGIDLSGGMLAKAAERGIYDDLAEAEMVAYQDRHPASFDLIVSADTLIYLGDLLPFFRAAAKALRSGGHLVVVMERLEDGGGPGFRLQHHGRYAHREAYVKDCLTASGLSLRAIETVVIRKEFGHPVAGMLVTAGRTNGGETGTPGVS